MTKKRPPTHDPSPALGDLRRFISAAHVDPPVDDDDEAVIKIAEVVWREMRDSLSRARAEADLNRQRAAAEASPVGDPITIAELFASRIKLLRELCDRTQEHLAADMRSLGFVTWKRITVAETESAKRRPSWEELFGLAVLFGLPVADLIGFGAKWGQAIRLNERVTINALSLKLLAGVATGPDGEITGHGVDLATGARVIGVDPGSPQDWRPGVALWGSEDQ